MLNHELKPLDIIDNRTPEQIRENGNERYLRIGTRVRIQYGLIAGHLGTVEEYIETHAHPWMVRPDDPCDAPVPNHRIALKSE